MIRHEEMCINFRDASTDTMDNRRLGLQDQERFYINFWQGSYGEKFENKPKPQFNKLWRGINRAASNVNNQEYGPKITPNSQDATQEGASLLEKKYRNDAQNKRGVEASEIATMEAFVGGMGATKWVAKYEDEESPDPDRQYMCLEPIECALAFAFWDAGSKYKDKADSRWCWHLEPANRKATEEEFGVSVVSFYDGVNNYAYTLNRRTDTQKDIMLAHYYELVTKKLRVHDFTPVGGPIITTGDGIKDEQGNKYTREEFAELKNDYLDLIGEPVSSIGKTKVYVEYALADGEKYLTKPQRLPFDRVPIYPRYGYYARLHEGEFFCGEVRKQTDSEMYYNLHGSNMMSILNESPTQKPIFAPEQVAPYATSWARANIDDTPFLFADPLKENGNVLVPGPLGYQQPPQLGTGHAAAGQFLEQNLMQSNGTGQSTVPSNASGAAIQQVNERTDDAYLPLVKNTIFAKRAECESWIVAAQDKYFTNPMMIRVQEINGDFNNIMTNQPGINEQGNYSNYQENTARGKYTVQIKANQSYKTTQEQKYQSNLELMAAVGSETEAGQIIAFENMRILNEDQNPMIEALAKYGPLNVIAKSGIPYTPQDEEERQYLEQVKQQMQQTQMQQQEMQRQVIQQSMQENANARMMEGQAAIMNEQNDAVKNQIEMEKVITDRAKVEIEAEKAQVDIDVKRIDSQLKIADKFGSMGRLM